MDPGQIDESVGAAIDRMPLAPLLEALDGAGAHLVGGWPRELLAGRPPSGDVDVAVDAEIEPLTARLEREHSVEVHGRHERFGTATVILDGLRIDLSRTRRETYPRPGALPEVEPAPIEEDLARRDFTVNAIAIDLRPPHRLLDPYGGSADVRDSVLRVLHERSFVDDPTRAIRAARYASRLGLTPDPETLALLRAADLATVTADRRDAELARLAAEATAPAGFRLLADWGLLERAPATLELIATADALAGERSWADAAVRSRAILLAASGGPRLEAALRLSRAEPERPSEAVRLAAGHQPAELLLAAAAGARWIDDLFARWSEVRLEIGGEDLLAAGVPQGPAIGRALRRTLERKLDGGLEGGRDAELELALALAREEPRSI